MTTPSLDPTLRGLCYCGCCEGTAVATPIVHHNRPGLRALAYRIGTHPTLKETLRARLASADLPALARLETRDDDDVTLALLDAWATVGDVLTFYQERIANEAYLGTATERRSVLELARLIGYQLRPGVAADAYLAFTVEDATGGTQTAALAALTDDTATVVAPPTRATIEQGTKVQSVPGPDETAQVFETTEAVVARPAWNALRPRRQRRRQPAFGDTAAWFAGVTTGLEAGDALLFVGQERLDAPASDRWDLRRVVRVEPDADHDHTRVVWKRPLGDARPRRLPAAAPRIYALRQRASVFGHNAPDWPSLPDETKAAYLGLAGTASLTATDKREWPMFQIFSPRNPLDRRRGRTFPRLTNDTVDFDQPYPAVTDGSWLVLTVPDGTEALYRATAVTESARAAFQLASKTTRVQLAGDMTRLRGTFRYALRTTTAFIASEELTLAETPLERPVRGTPIELDRVVAGLASGRTLLVTGRPARQVRVVSAGRGLRLRAGTRSKRLRSGQALVVAADTEPLADRFDRRRWWLMDASGFVGSVVARDGAIVFVRSAEEDRQPISEVVTLAAATTTTDRAHTRLALTKPLVNVYERASVTIAANVAAATHGESVAEVLGSGDGGQRFQRFALKQPPLTHTSAASAAGTASTLELRINDLLWREVSSLYGRGPDERVYATALDDDGTTTVITGDGRTGARAPTGANNVRARYRKGLGRGGRVAAGQLSQLMTRPLGVQTVVNSLPASGGGDAERLADARANATLTIRTLDRIVSLQDYEDFASAYAGIGKALATWTWNGERNGVFVTAAGSRGTRLVSDLQQKLLAAMRQAGDPTVPLAVASYVPRTFRITASVQVAGDRVKTTVLTAVEAALRAAFSFTARGFGQPVASSEVLAVIQGVAGVTAVDLDTLARVGSAAASGKRAPAVPALLVAAAPRPGARQARAAELLTLDPRPIGLEASP